MKRNILALGLLSLCCLGLAASESQAFFGMFNPWNPYSFCNRHNRYVTTITCRPYNAFTPIAWGNLVCDGCVPNPCGVASGCLPVNMGVPPWACPGGGCGMPGLPSYMNGGGCGPGGCGSDGCCASDMHGAPMMHGSMAMPYNPSPMPYSPGPMPYGPPMPAPADPRSQPFMPPMPMPVGPNTTMMYPQQPGLAQANYQPAYYPMPAPNYYTPNYYMPNYYNPYAGYQPQQQPMPYYWYGAGR